MKDILKINNIKKTYQTKTGEINALDGISFTANEGEFVSIIGPSGCGISSLLYIIA